MPVLRSDVVGRTSAGIMRAERGLLPGVRGAMHGGG